MASGIGALLPEAIRLAQPIGRGVLFDSFIARDEITGHRVFCKIQRDDIDRYDSMPDVYLRLWMNLARVQLPGMPRIFNAGRFEGRVFQVCEWVDGIPLHDLALEPGRFHGRVGRFSERLLEQCLTTLVHLHGAHILHGDISPSNILVSETLDNIWMIDPSPVRFSDGLVIATQAWAAPEILDGRTAGPWSDLYSLGKVVAAFSKRIGAAAPESVNWLTSPRPQDRPRSAEYALSRVLSTPEGIETEYSYRSRNVSPPSVASPNLGFARITRSTKRIVPGLANIAGQIVLAGVAPIIGAAIGAFGAISKLGSVVEKYGSQSPSSSGAQGSAATAQQAAAGARDTWSDRTGISNVPVRASSVSEPQDADFIVMGPTLVAREHSFPLELWVGPSEKTDELRERATNRGYLIERGARSRIELPTSVTITAIMVLPGFDVVNPTEQIHWDGSIRNTAFVVNVPPDRPSGRYAGLVKLAVDALPLGTISFNIEIAGSRISPDSVPEQLSGPIRRYRTAFASYSRRNTAEVFKRVQAIRAGEIDIFVDIANLRGGDRWQDVLMREIAARDVFFLFWSREAARSAWVEKEWREALDRRGLDFICPIPLEDPRFAEPPKELQDLHFNDWCLAMIRSEQAIGEGRESGVSA